MKVLVITTPGSVGVYTDGELAVLQNYVAAGTVSVFDETAGAPTDLGGALYHGQRLTLRKA